MRRSLGLLLVIIMATTLGGCISGGGGGSSDSGGNSAVSNESNVRLFFNLSEMLAMNRTNQDIMLAKLIDFITMSKAAYATETYTFITSLYIRVTGSGMPDIIHEAGISDPSSVEATLTVTNGPNRRFYIELKDRNNWALYSGDLIIDVGNAGASQEITVDVAVDDGINAGDYVAIGRQHLENRKLELAYIAFDTAVSIEANHPEANFFRGFTHLLLLVQKDDTDVNVTQPNADIAAVLNLYANLDNIYLSSIAPDIYNENYGTDLDSFYHNDWVEPSGVTTDSGVDVLENVILPELEHIISDFSKAEAEVNPVFSTTFTPSMYFDISSTIKVDRADVYILEAIAYGLKAYFNQSLANNLRTNANYWKDEFDKKDDGIEGNYYGAQYILNRDPGAPQRLLDETSGAQTYLDAAKSAFSTGLDKLKAGLQFIDTIRTIAVKEAEDNIFNLADIDDAVNPVLSLNILSISKIKANIDEIKNSLSGAATITCYEHYDDDTTTADLAKANLSVPFSTAGNSTRDSLPELYYHQIGDMDLPIFDTNDDTKSAEFIDKLNDVIISYKDSEDVDWHDINTTKDALEEEFLPTPYKLAVPNATTDIQLMTGYISDWDGIEPVAFDGYDKNKAEGIDLRKVYMAKDDTYFYIALEFRGSPYLPPSAGEYFQYHIRFHAASHHSSDYEIPVNIQLRYDSGWTWNLMSYNNNKGNITEPGFGYTLGPEIVEFKIPLNYIKAKINLYEPAEDFPPTGWDGKELYISASYYLEVSGVWQGDSCSGVLGELNI